MINTVVMSIFVYIVYFIYEYLYNVTKHYDTYVRMLNVIDNNSFTLLKNILNDISLFCRGALSLYYCQQYKYYTYYIACIYEVGQVRTKCFPTVVGDIITVMPFGTSGYQHTALACNYL